MTADYNFYMLMSCAGLAILCLTRLVINDIGRVRRRFK